MQRRRRALFDAPGAAGSVAERPPRSRGVALLGFAFVLALAATFVLTLVRQKPVNVPRGLLGVRFGMSESDVRRRLPGLTALPDGKLAGSGRVFDERGQCELGFRGDRTLSAVVCTIESEDRERAKQRVVSTARQLYGAESDWQAGELERWSWQSSRARLSIVAQSGGAPALRVENVELSR
jgi:hypothetical protein